jgi:hypothetical protein
MVNLAIHFMHRNDDVVKPLLRPTLGVDQSIARYVTFVVSDISVRERLVQFDSANGFRRAPVWMTETAVAIFLNLLVRTNCVNVPA